ncbi:MAG: prolipoprotein diacylglyceryl transferase [Lachnospiraceae bacterium]|nr:prolipoprotein diacylglyceryl transferase [Lachnospiraceae bacterium]
MKIDLFSIGPVTVHGYGLMIGIGVICCIIMGMKRAKKYGLSDDAVIDIAILGLIAGFLGAKLLFVIVEWKSFIADPLSLLGSQGFVVYGGITAGVLAAIIYCKRKKLIFLEYFDLCAASIALAQAFGRIGCFMAGCCYGKETDLPIGVIFPESSLAPTGVKVLPTQLFSSAGNFCIMFLLLWHYKHRKKVGDSGFFYMLLYGVGRFFMEFLRNDDRGKVGVLSTSQFISLLIVAAAILLFCWKGRKPVEKEVNVNTGE